MTLCHYIPIHKVKLLLLISNSQSIIYFKKKNFYITFSLFFQQTIRFFNTFPPISAAAAALWPAKTEASTAPQGFTSARQSMVWEKRRNFAGRKFIKNGNNPVCRRRDTFSQEESPGNAGQSPSETEVIREGKQTAEENNRPPKESKGEKAG